MTPHRIYTPARFHNLEAQLAEFKTERLELLRQLRRLEVENVSLRDRLAAEQLRSNQLVAKMGAEVPQWTQPSFSDYY